MELKFISSGKLAEFRKEQWEKQNGICPVTGKYMDFDDCVVDHLHKKKSEKLGINGKGMVRGVIHRNVNSAEGSAHSSYVRRGVSSLMGYADYLIALGNFIKNPPLSHLNLVHPTEAPKMDTFGKREFKRLIKYWPQMYPKRKLPVWKDKGRNGKVTGKMNRTKKFDELIEQANKIHYAK